MNDQPQKPPFAPADGICRNDRKVQTTCTTACKLTQKIKGKHHPASAERKPPEFQ